MDEFELIAALTARFQRGGAATAEHLVPGSAPWVDIGDDAAVLHADPRPLVVSVDASVEGVHFARSFATAHDIGFRALMAAASDLAAMGAEPESVLLALIIAKGTPPEWLLSLADGYAEAAGACGLRVVGGNVSRGDVVSLTSTVLGRMPDGVAPLERKGAQVGDDVYVGGPLGGAALGLAAIQAGAEDELPTCVERWRRPRARLALGAALRGLATSAIDLSDGLLQDVAHLAEASRVGLELTLSALPVPDGFVTQCARLGLAPSETVLTGGEDYELAFTAPRARREQLGAQHPEVHRIGEVVTLPGVRVLDARGETLERESAAGFRHQW